MLGELICRLRKRSGASMQVLAGKLGLASRNTIHRWETGASVPDAAQLGRLLDAVGASDEERLEALRLAATPDAHDDPVLNGALAALEEAEADGEGEAVEGAADDIVLDVDSEHPQGRGDGEDQLARGVA